MEKTAVSGMNDSDLLVTKLYVLAYEYGDGALNSERFAKRVYELLYEADDECTKLPSRPA